jgi:hypothetical protein
MSSVAGDGFAIKDARQSHVLPSHTSISPPLQRLKEIKAQSRPPIID